MKAIRTFSLLLIGAALLAIAGVGWLVYNQFRTPDPETIVSTSLEAFKEQNRLVPFTARFVSIATTQDTNLGLTSKKTLILPGTVRYEIDLSQLTEDDLDWNAGNETLSITLPPIELGGPEFALEQPREYKDGGLILFLTGKESEFDDANRKAAKADIITQARGEGPMKLARSAATRAVESSFVLPLRAIGIEAKVVAKFETEGNSP